MYALTNLLSNALDFSPPQSTITVKGTVHADVAAVTVQDKGPGVPDFALERIFERFFSLPRPDTKRKSSGLGLSIVKEIAELHSGSVSIRNESAGGATAELRLPLRITRNTGR